jgi:hypothetical protein
MLLALHTAGWWMVDVKPANFLVETIFPQDSTSGARWAPRPLFLDLGSLVRIPGPQVGHPVVDSHLTQVSASNAGAGCGGCSVTPPIHPPAATKGSPPKLVRACTPSVRNE